jgi:hypothetical protein
VSGRIPLRIEATIDALSDIATARSWAWSGDTALYGYDLLRWRDHRDVIILTGPKDTYDPDAVRMALAHDPPVATYHGCAVVTVGAGDQQHQVVLRSCPDITSGPVWDELTLPTRPHRAAAPRRTLSFELTCRDVVDRWSRSQFALDTTIDAITVADAIGHQPFGQLIEQLPAPVLERARTTLGNLADHPDPRLAALVAPADMLELRECARRLQQAMRSQGLTR